MCGIVGMAGNMNLGHREYFTDLLDVCQVRGRHSTGAVAVKPLGSFDIAKQVGPPANLFETKSFDTRIMNGLKKIYLGHCRAKTIGDATRANAHPFEHDHIVGVHNGTLRDFYQMEGYKDFDVDSDLLYYHIAKYGAEEVIPKLNNDGAWALVWWDEYENTLNFLRNDKRELWVTHSKDQKVMYWASEPWMFNAVTRRGVELWEGSDKVPAAYKLEENILFSFEVNDNGKTGKEVFKLRPLISLKGEVRGYQGNMNHRGSGGARSSTVSNIGPNARGPKVEGGEVADPFSQHRQSVEARADESWKNLLRRRMEARKEALDDTVDDVGKENQVLLPPFRESTKIPEESSTTTSGEEASTTSSPNTSDTKTESKKVTTTGRGKLSLAGRNSNFSPQEDNENSSSSSKDAAETCTNQSPVKHFNVSLRSIAGMEFITDLVTGKEFSEQRLEEATACLCTFCKGPIGGLSDIADLFVTNPNKMDETIALLCKPCKVPYLV